MPEFTSDEQRADHLAALERELGFVRAYAPEREAEVLAEIRRVGGQRESEKRPRGRVGRQER